MSIIAPRPRRIKSLGRDIAVSGDDKSKAAGIGASATFSPVNSKRHQHYDGAT
jgi:hypothetical protein